MPIGILLWVLSSYNQYQTNLLEASAFFLGFTTCICRILPSPMVSLESNAVTTWNATAPSFMENIPGGM